MQSDLSKQLTPKEIVTELDKYIVGQANAKKAVAIAIRNRARRMNVESPMREEIAPKNIIMIGPTGVGKTEIARRLAALSNAPFVKVEATKFTEVGYIGRDVESIVRDLAQASYRIVENEEKEKVLEKAKKEAEEQLLSYLLPSEDEHSAREMLKGLLQKGELEDRKVSIEISKKGPKVEIMGPSGFSEMEGQIQEVFSNMMPKGKDRKELKVKEARKILIEEAQVELLDKDKLSDQAIELVQNSGIVFIDEIDKICQGSQNAKGGDVSREGVQRDLLPLVEGTTVATKYGNIKTDHILFIASGAFHYSSPSDLMPEFQGRFPIRVELASLSKEDFYRILKEPKSALTKQYSALLKTEGVELVFEDSAIEEISRLTQEINTKMENIGARRLHTLLEKLLEDVSFNSDDHKNTTVSIDKDYVLSKLAELVEDQDLSNFIL